MVIYRGYNLVTKMPKPSPKSENCRQHILSPICHQQWCSHWKLVSMIGSVKGFHCKWTLLIQLVKVITNQMNIKGAITITTKPLSSVHACRRAKIVWIMSMLKNEDARFFWFTIGFSFIVFGTGFADLCLNSSHEKIRDGLTNWFSDQKIDGRTRERFLSIESFQR